jgi:catechol 2,3-dioxygenase-like lactoylglutathione lyase family enzyme
MDSQAAELQETRTEALTPCGFGHIAIPSRDMAQSKQFFVDVLGGTLAIDEPARARVRFGNFAVELAPQPGGATPAHAEYPHYAFTVAPEDFMGIKQRLEGFGVPTHDPWGRMNRTHALMYFRDPSGNQFELFCPSGFNAVPLRLGHRAGGNYVINFPALCYKELRTPASKLQLPEARLRGYNHMTLPVRDMYEAKRFFVAVLGGTVAFERPAHITVIVGGAEIGLSSEAGGWTAPDAEYPHYTFLVRADDLAPLKQRLESYNIPTSDIWTRNGVDAAMYLRDPSGNLWELYCDSGFKGALLRASSPDDGYEPDVKALNYGSWKDPGERAARHMAAS